MIIQNSNFIILFLINRYHLKLILFTIFLSSSFYFYDIFAIDEMDEKNLSLNNSFNNGNTFSKPINLSNNTGFSEHPQIAVTKNGIYIVWADNTNSNNTEIMFTKSEDNGTTFSKVINLSKNSKNSNNVEISAFDENVYVVWQDIDDQNNNNNKNS